MELALRASVNTVALLLPELGSGGMEYISLSRRPYILSQNTLQMFSLIIRVIDITEY